MRKVDANSVVDKKVTSYGKKCRKCNTDFRVGMSSINEELVLVVTKWFNLGPGLAPDDRRWSVHNWTSMSEGQEHLDDRGMEINVRDAFESKSPRDLKELRSHHLSCPKDQRNRQFMRLPYPAHEFLVLETRVRKYSGSAIRQ